MKNSTLTLSALSLVFLTACTPVNPPATGDTGTQQPSVNDQGNAGDAMMNKDDDVGLKMMKEGTEEDKEKDQAMMKKDEGTMMKNSDAMKKEETMIEAGEYKDFTASNLSASVLADGKTKVLFFHASWCPICKRANQTLTSWYADGKGMLTVYKINYDEEKMLEQKYGVTYQHTFVKVDGQGNMIEKMQGPSDDELRALLKA